MKRKKDRLLRFVDEFIKMKEVSLKKSLDGITFFQSVAKYFLVFLIGAISIVKETNEGEILFAFFVIDFIIFVLLTFYKWELEERFKWIKKYTD